MRQASCWRCRRLRWHSACLQFFCLAPVRLSDRKCRPQLIHLGCCDLIELVSIPKYGIKSAHLIQYGDLEENVLSFLKGIKPGKFLKGIKPVISCWYMVHRQTVDSGTESNRRYHLRGSQNGPEQSGSFGKRITSNFYLLKLGFRVKLWIL